jgi:hypothetical protein
MNVCRHSVQRTLATAIVASAAVGMITLSCGDSSPSTSTPPTTVAPQPTPTPPTGGGGVGSSSCPFGKGSGSAVCVRESTFLLQDVEDAIDRVIAAHPEIFDLTREAAPKTRAFYVLDREAYLEALVNELREAGLCAEQDYDGGETISVKDSSDFSEDFDVLLSDGFIRRGSGAYRQTCNPASFPLDPNPSWPPRGSGCMKPYPPPVSRFNVKVHLKSGDVNTIDSTPLVGPDEAYCAAIGFAGRALCPVRVEGAPDREACEAWRVGEAADTGRIGPTWTYEGQPCTGPEMGCQNHPSNQFQVLGYRLGNYQACATNGACGQVEVKP